MSDVLHGGEPRPTSEEIAAEFAKSDAKHTRLLDEIVLLNELLIGSGRELSGQCTAYGRYGTTYEVFYTTATGRWKLTLEER